MNIFVNELDEYKKSDVQSKFGFPLELLAFFDWVRVEMDIINANNAIYRRFVLSFESSCVSDINTLQYEEESRDVPADLSDNPFASRTDPNH